MTVQVFTPGEDTDARILCDNIIFFCTTPKGSLPQMRDYGIDYDALDKPFAQMRMILTVSIISGIRKYYGMQIRDIDITADKGGEAMIKIKI